MSMELGPYTNFHELNLDWFLNEFNKVLAEWENMQKSFSDLNAAFSDLRNYVYDYFKNLDVQEEIDKKLDDMANDGSLYAIIRKYTDPIVNEQNSKITVLENRMNTFTSLPEGSTSGDAELIDIRVPAAGFNGNNTYPNAGDAVRGQVGELKSDLATLQDVIYVSTDNIDYTGYDTNRALSETGKYVKDGSVILSFPVTEGDLIYVNLVNSQGNSILYFFQSVKTVPWESNTNIVGNIHRGESFKGLITVPNGATYLVTNTDMSNLVSIVKNTEFFFNEDSYMAYKNTYIGNLSDMKVGTYAVSSDNVIGLPTGMNQKYGWLTCYVPNNLYTLIESSTQKTVWLKEGVSDWKNISQKSNKLKDKKIAYNGDSICESRLSGFANNGGAYAKLIADITGCTYENRAVSGGTLAVSSATHNICNDISNMCDDADLICLEGGINDYWLSVPLGTYSESDYTSEIDKNTVCGALESILRESINKWVGKPICFVLTHKIKDTVWNNNYSGGYTFKEQHEKMIGILNKYSIPYYDCFTNGILNGYIDSLNNAYLNGGGNTHPDGTHPDEGGYVRYYVPQLISLFESILPN